MTTDPYWVEPGEKTLWSGRPVPLRYVLRQWQAHLIGAIPAIGLLIAFYFIPGEGAWTTFIAIVACVFAASFLFALVKAVWLAWHTIYALTERRALILAGHESTSFWMRDLRSLKVRERRDGFGDIVLREASTGSEGDRFPEQGFFAIGEVRTVARLIHATIDSTSDKSSSGGP